MKNQRRGASALLLAVLLGTAACADDIPAVPQETETGTTTGTDTLPPVTSTSTSGADTTETASGGATGTTSTGSSSDSGSSGSSSGGDSTTGEPAVPGRTMSQLVSAGTRTASRNYTLVHTLGQPSSLQSTHQSTSYRLQGGLVGANGSPP